MSYNIGLKTESEAQAKEILDFINKNVPQLNSWQPKKYHILYWLTGNEMGYIENPCHVGVSYSILDNIESIYFYSVMYQIGLKFNLYEIINKEPCVLLNYDDEATFYLSVNNPFKEGDEQYLSHCPIREDGIKLFQDKGLIGELLGLSPSKKELEFIQLTLDNIKNG